MTTKEAVFAGLWGGNFLVVCGLNPTDVGHCIGVLILYAAAYFLFAPLHGAILLGVWTAYGLDRASSTEDGAFWRAVQRLFTAESLVFWAVYWGMILEVVPLHIRL